MDDQEYELGYTDNVEHTPAPAPSPQKPSAVKPKTKQHAAFFLVGVAAVVIGIILIVTSQAVSSRATVVGTECNISGFFGANNTSCSLTAGGLGFLYNMMQLIGWGGIIAGVLLFLAGIFGTQDTKRLNKPIQQNPKSVSAYYDRALYAYKTNDYASTLADCNKVLELDPKNPAAYNLRATVWLNKRQYDNALADYKRAVAFAPQKQMYRDNLKKCEVKAQNG